MVGVLAVERDRPERPPSRWRCWFVFVLADALLKLPQPVLGPCFVAWAGLSLAAFSFLLVRLRRGRRSLAATARRVELAFPELESHLINLVQFAERDGRSADPFRQAAMAQSAAAVADFPFDQAATRESRWRRFALCMQTPRDLLESSWSSARPGACPAHERDRSRLGLLDPPAPPPVHVRPLRGLGQDRQGRSGGCRGPDRIGPADLRRDRRTLAHRHLLPGHTVRAPGREARIAADDAARREQRRRIVAALSQVLAPLQYRLQIGDSQTRLYQVTVYEKPTVAEVEATYDFPAYLERPSETVRQNQGDLEAPQFTRAELKIHPSTPIARGHLS